jgi:acyl transferase domain-containing protein
MMNSVADLYTAGYPVDFAGLYPDRRPVVSLPHYPWQRRRFWLDTPEPPREQVAVEPVHWLEELIGLPDDEQEAAIESAVRADAATVLQLPSPSDVPVDGKFMELGMDSLMTVQLRHELTARTGLALPSTLAFDHPTPRAITRYLLKMLAEREEDGS